MVLPYFFFLIEFLDKKWQVVLLKYFVWIYFVLLFSDTMFRYLCQLSQRNWKTLERAICQTYFVVYSLAIWPFISTPNLCFIYSIGPGSFLKMLWNFAWPDVTPIYNSFKESHHLKYTDYYFSFSSSELEIHLILVSPPHLFPISAFSW